MERMRFRRTRGATRGGGYNPVRGEKVIAWTRAFLDEAAPLAAGSHSDVFAYRVDGGVLAADLSDGATGLADPGLFAGYRGDPAAPETVLLRHNGLHIEIAIDRTHPVGQDRHGGRVGRRAGIGRDDHRGSGGFHRGR